MILCWEDEVNMKHKKVIMFILLVLAISLGVGLVYFLYCRSCYNRQMSVPQNNILSTPQEVDDFISESGPFSKENLKLIRDAEEEAYMYPEWDKKMVGNIYIEITSGNFWNPQMEIVKVVPTSGGLY